MKKLIDIIDIKNEPNILNNMTHLNENYKGYTIQKRTDVKMHTCIIYKGDDLVKCIAGDILADGSENSTQKAKQWIDTKLSN